jgi:hypothetical protein
MVLMHIEIIRGIHENKNCGCFPRIRSFLYSSYVILSDRLFSRNERSFTPSLRESDMAILWRVGHLHRHPIEGEVAGIIVGDVRDADAEVREVTA